MSVKVGWLAVATDAATTRDALEKVAPDAPVGIEHVAVHATDRGTAVMLRDRYGAVAEWAQRVSHHAACVAVGVLAFDGTWSLDVFDRGEHVLFLDSHLPEMPPLLGGDVARAAACLGIEPKLLERYHRLLVRAHETGEIEAKAVASDEFAAADEWGHACLAARWSLPAYPDDAGEVVAVSCSGDAWTSMARLPISICAPSEIPKSVRFSSADAQRAAITWIENWFEVAPELGLRFVERLATAGPAEVGIAVRGRWLSCISLVRAGRRDQGLAETRRLLEDWLKPPTIGAVNQFLHRFELGRLRAALATESDPVVHALLARVEAVGDVEIALGDGDSF